MGIVYLAQDEALLRQTAVKVLSWAFLKSNAEHPEAWFLAEARSVARINHPAVVQVYNAAKHGDHCYIAMEYVEGVSGEELLRIAGPLPPGDATRVVLQVAGALDQAHLLNIIHRDVKPANILIKAGGSTKLGDFGMAMHSASYDLDGGAPVGTPNYIAPEMWQGLPASHLTDIYALGATYFQLLTGRPPYQAGDVHTLINAHLQSPVPDPTAFVPGVSPECSRIVAKCLAKLPAERYQSCQELAWDLRGVLRRLHCEGDVRGADAIPLARPAEASTPQSTSEEGAEEWVANLDLSQRPFSPVREGQLPYVGEPLQSVGDRLDDFASGEPGGILILGGARGCGTSTLLRQALARLDPETPRAFLGRQQAQGLLATRSLSQWACQALGALPSTSTRRDADLEGLIEHLSACSRPALIVLDSVITEASYRASLPALIRAARSTRCMSLVLAGESGLAERLLNDGLLKPGEATIVSLEPLDAEQTGAYINAWLSFVRRPGGPALLLTADAAAIVSHRADGNLTRINRIATNMLRIALRQNKRVLSSWYAWKAPVTANWSPEKEWDLNTPADWPSDEALQIINAAREKAGVALRERSAVRT